MRLKWIALTYQCTADNWTKLSLNPRVLKALCSLSDRNCLLSQKSTVASRCLSGCPLFVDFAGLEAIGGNKLPHGV